MDKLSKLYRNDSDEISPELRQKLDEVFLPTLAHLDRARVIQALQKVVDM